MLKFMLTKIRISEREKHRIRLNRVIPSERVRKSEKVREETRYTVRQRQETVSEIDI